MSEKTFLPLTGYEISQLSAAQRERYWEEEARRLPAHKRIIDPMHGYYDYAATLPLDHPTRLFSVSIMRMFPHTRLVESGFARQESIDALKEDRILPRREREKWEID